MSEEEVDIWKLLIVRTVKHPPDPSTYKMETKRSRELIIFCYMTSSRG